MSEAGSSVVVGQLADLQIAVKILQEKVDHCTDEVYALSKKKNKSLSYDDDENKERGNWTGRLDFLLSCLGYAVGLGNVWRFPYLCYRNGGGAFFIPYCIMLVFVGMPIFLLELTLGQFSSHGPLTCWQFAPIFKGVGIAMILVSGMVSIYYNMIIGWSFYYLFASFTSDLPWAQCGEWSSQFCSTKLMPVSWDNCTSEMYEPRDNGVCYNNGTAYGIWNETLAKTFNIQKTTAAEEYLESVVLGISAIQGMDDIGSLRWQLVLCYLLAWVVVYFALINGVKSSGKVVYFTATFPYIILVILLVRGVTLEGYYEGIMFYITPDLDRLADARVWKDAAVQIFFSLSASWGGLIALSSYNRFRNDIVRDTMIVTIGNCATSVFAGFVIFSFLGHLSYELGVPVGEVAKDGVTLAFVVYPSAITSMPVSTLWAILFFIMLLTLGLDSQFVLVETVTTAITDQFPATRKYRSVVNFLFCAIMFLLGLTLCTHSGAYWLQLMDHYAGGWNVLLIAFCECAAVSWVYGIRRFLKDLGVMLGYNVCGCFSWTVCRFWWALCWAVITPIGVTILLAASWYDYEEAKYNTEAFPTWANSLGWMMTFVVVVAIILTASILVITTPGPFCQRLQKLLSPTIEWGPALPEHRRLVDYANMVSDPWANPEKPDSDSNGMVLVSKFMPYDHREDGVRNPAFYTSPPNRDPSVYIAPKLENEVNSISQMSQPPKETSTPRNPLDEVNVNEYQPNIFTASDATSPRPADSPNARFPTPLSEVSTQTA